MFERATPKTQQKKKKKRRRGGSSNIWDVYEGPRVEEGGGGGKVGKRIILFQRTEYLIRNSKM